MNKIHKSDPVWSEPIIKYEKKKWTESTLTSGNEVRKGRDQSVVGSCSVDKLLLTGKRREEPWNPKSCWKQDVCALYLDWNQRFKQSPLEKRKTRAIILLIHTEEDMQKLNPAGLSLKSFKRSCCGVRFQVLLGWGNIGRAEDGSS